MGCCASLLKCCVRAETENPLLDSGHSGGGAGNGQQVDLNLDFEELRDVHYLTNGGMCSIYTAEWRGRRVVVKMPRDDCAQPEVARKDLETEIDILQRLQHPNIVEMLGAGFVCPLDVDADGQEHGEFRGLDQPLIMNYLAGRSVRAQSRGHPCSRRQQSTSNLLVRPIFVRGNLVGTNVVGTNVAGTYLVGTNLPGTNLVGTNPVGTNVAGTNLPGRNLVGTNLAGTNLVGTNLVGTNLAGTNLVGTNLAGTNLFGTNLVGTNLVGPIKESKRFVLLEYLVGGTLTEQMCMRNPPPDGMMSSVVRRWQQNWQFPTKKAIDSALQLSSALSYLHCRAVEGSFVVHRDLKPENIAFSSDGRLKLFDFGLAKIVRRRTGRLSQRYEMTGETGSTRYMCPEVAMQLPYNEKADVYSFGLILWEMLSLRRPFEGLNRKEFVQSVIKGGRRPPLQHDWSGSLRELMRRCWDEDMDVRPEFVEVEEALRDITQREATWGGMLSSSPSGAAAAAAASSSSSAPSERTNGSSDAGSINGRAGSKPLAGGGGGAGAGLIVGVGVSNGGVGGDTLPETRTLV